ncbi:MAG: response regulator transcription factor [Mesorhizobium sp.]
MVEDDKMIGEGLQKALTQSGFAANWVQNGDSAEVTLMNEIYDLIILDLGLPDRSGLELLRWLRGKMLQTPVLILTARDSVMDRVGGLDAGADDYLLKPFALEELEARIRSLLRRSVGQAGQEGWLRHEKLALNPKTHEAQFDQAKAILSGREFALLFALMRSPQAILSKAQLEERIYGWNEEVASNAVEVHIHQIRKKLGSEVIKNLRGVGYTLSVPG